MSKFIFNFKIYRITFNYKGKKYKGYINLIGNTKIYPSASLIGIDEYGNITRFGSIDNNVSLNYVKEKSNIFLQEHLVGVDNCNSYFFKKMNYNVKYKFYCDNTLSKRKPKVNVLSFDECDLEVYIFSKEACNYERLTYDSFLYEQKIFISFIYIYLSVLLLLPCQKVQFFATNSLLFIILFSTLIFNF